MTNMTKMRKKPIILRDERTGVSGRSRHHLEDLDDSLDLSLESEEYDSLGGFIIERLDRLPDPGDAIETESELRLVVESMDKNRIERVHLYLPD